MHLLAPSPRLRRATPLAAPLAAPLALALLAAAPAAPIVTTPLGPIVTALAAQPASAARPVRPVLAFPEPGLDDSAAYQGYQTRLFRDGAGNTLQIYLDGRQGRVVHVWADADDESLAFSARDPQGRPVPLRWDGAGASVGGGGRARALEHRLVADAPSVQLGWFLLGSMRVERDFQYEKRHLAPYASPAFALPEIERLLAALARLAPAERRRQLAPLGVTDVAALRARLRPVVTAGPAGVAWRARVVQRTLDGRDSLTLEISADPRRVVATRAGDSLSLRSRDGGTVPFTVRVATTGAPLSPLTREQIFTPEFLTWLASGARATGATGATGAGGDSAAARARWTERSVRGVELLASREKLMAGLPTYATYFGRDMLVSALMMRPIWRDEMSEFVVASALRKLSPTGQVSHEEALGGQATREAAAEYAALVDAHLAAAARGDRAAADSLLARAATVLREQRRVRENYHMIDDELQLPVLAARWLVDGDVAAARKRAFLADTTDSGEPRLARLLRELALVARMTAPYAAQPTAANLIGFERRDSTRWASSSWRDSGVGYANGRYAMDVNAIWAPHALVAMGQILGTVRALGLPLDSLARAMPELAAGTPIGGWLRDSLALRRAVETWRGAGRHFVVRLGPDSVRAAVARRMAAMPAPERAHWTEVLARTHADRDSLTFLALSLDAEGRPIGVANTDPATRLFLGEPGGAIAARPGEPGGAVAATPGEPGGAVAARPGEPAGAADPATTAAVLRDVRLFVRPYPVGLFVDRVGPVVANDAYAAPEVWRAFVEDAYHGPRVAWGREVNLFLLGVADRVAEAGGSSASGPVAAAYVRELREAAERVVGAVAASGFHSELWSYDFPGGRLTPVRYGSGADVQLWSTTDLAVEFALARMRR